jgi:hypothetical protein
MSRLLQKFHLENRTQLALHIERLRLFGESVVAPELTSAVAGQ